MILGVAIWGVILGLCVGFTAIGTGILGSPGLILLFQIDPVVAVGTISLAAIPMLASSVIKHSRAKNIEWKIAALFSITSMPSAYLAARYATVINEIFPVKNIIAAVILISLPLLIYRYRLADRNRHIVSERPLWLVPIVGAVLGSVMGATGITGSLTVIAFLLIFHLRTKAAVGTTSCVGFVSLVVASFAHYKSGNYDWQVLISLLPGVIGGSYIGAAFVNKVPRNVLRYSILSIVAISGIMILLR